MRINLEQKSTGSRDTDGRVYRAPQPQLEVYRTANPYGRFTE